MGEAGFGPAKSKTTDLQSAPFGRSGIPPGAGDRSRTNNLLITNQLLCLIELYQHKSNDWCFGAESNHRHGDFQSPALPTELPKQNIGDPEGARTLDLQRDRLAL